MNRVGLVRESRGQCAPIPTWMTWRVMCVCVYFACLAVVCVIIIILSSLVLTECECVCVAVGRIVVGGRRLDVWAGGWVVCVCGAGVVGT